MKDKNPVENVRFFANWEDTKAFTIPKQRVSMLIPDEFSERYLRIYCRDVDLVCFSLFPTVKQLLILQFRLWMYKLHLEVMLKCTDSIMTGKVL